MGAGSREADTREKRGTVMAVINARLGAMILVGPGGEDIDLTGLFETQWAVAPNAKRCLAAITDAEECPSCSIFHARKCDRDAVDGSFFCLEHGVSSGDPH